MQITVSFSKFMRPYITIIILGILAAQAYGYQSRKDILQIEESTKDLSLRALEERKQDIETYLGQLARLSMNSGVGRIGYRSLPHQDRNTEEWIEIDLLEETIIDEIVLVPVLWRDAERSFIADAFPETFIITGGVTGSDEEIVIADFSGNEGILPRIAPLAISCPGTRVSYLRLKADSLSPRFFDYLFALQFSEIMVFSGHENVALGKPVKTTISSLLEAGSGAWDEDFLVDGFVPYLMDSAEGEGSLSFVNDTDPPDPPHLVNSPQGERRRSFVNDTVSDARPSIIIDLESSHILEQIILHVVEQADTVPQAFPGDYGVPYHFVLEGSENEDFSEATTLLEYKRDHVYDVGPIIVANLNPASSRYVRLTALEPFTFNGIWTDGSPFTVKRLGFAEIELYSKGVNVALNKPVDTNFQMGATVRKITALNDGSNLYGRILSIKDWMNQLAKRHDLEVEMPFVIAELEHRYEQQSKLVRMLWLSIGLVVFVVIVIVLATQQIQQRALFRTRERITADLHDVLGGNISAIALLSELAQQDVSNQAEVKGYMGRIDTLAIRTRNALKYITDMLGNRGIYENLFAEMRRSATGLTQGIDHQLDLKGEDYVVQISQRRRIDIFLFYKECLVNIIRHSHATEIRTSLEIDDSLLSLEVCDNGSGLPDTGVSKAPSSLMRRAKLLGGKVTVATNEPSGTCVRLTLNWRRPWLLRNVTFLIPANR